MARFLVVLKPIGPLSASELIQGLEPLLEHLEAEVDHRTPAHLSAMLRRGADSHTLQLFADVQAGGKGTSLELLLISREAMGKGAPRTRECLADLLESVERLLPQLELVFRSDRDGPISSPG
jgi:hypothetical protein